MDNKCSHVCPAEAEYWQVSVCVCVCGGGGYVSVHMFACV